MVRISTWVPSVIVVSPVKPLIDEVDGVSYEELVTAIVKLGN